MMPTYTAMWLLNMYISIELMHFCDRALDTLNPLQQFQSKDDGIDEENDEADVSKHTTHPLIWICKNSAYRT